MADTDIRAMLAYSQIDIDSSTPTLSVVHAKQYDTARKVEAHLYQNGSSWMAPRGNNVVTTVSYKKADRIGGFYDETDEGITAVTVDASDYHIIYIALDRQMLTTAGDVFVDVNFYRRFATTSGETAMSRLSTFSFKLEVEAASLTELDLSSNPYFNVLADDIAAVLHAEENLVGLTVSKQKLAPNAEPTVSVTGGQGSGNAYNINFGIPSMTTFTASATGLAAGANPTASVSGGASAGQAFNLAFGIPKGDKGDLNLPQTAQYAYAQTDSGTTVPSSWSSTRPTPEPLKYNWVRVTVPWQEGTPTVFYSVSYNGANGTGSTATEITAADGASVQSHLNTIETDVSNLQSDVTDLESDVVLWCSTGDISSLPVTKNNSEITSNHYLVAYRASNMLAVASNLTVTTSDGSFTITGTLRDTTKLYLGFLKGRAITLT